MLKIYVNYRKASLSKISQYTASTYGFKSFDTPRFQLIRKKTFLGQCDKVVLELM